MPFQFVDNATIDRKARKLIRSHVAKGRNVGKTHSRGQKHSSLGVTAATLICPTRATEHEGGSGSDESFTGIGPHIGDGLSVLSIPVDLTPRSRVLVQKIFSFMSGALYPSEILNVIDFAEATSMWIQYIFLDKAYFHCSVAMWVAAVNPLFVKQEDSITAMRHLSEAFRLVNEKLSGTEALSDTTMAVLVSMTQYERLRSQYRQGLVHFKGLERMVELRGGISRLMSINPGLTQKIFRADLEFALHLGSATRFGPEDLPGHDTISWLRSRFRQDPDHRFCDSQFARGLDKELQDILVDITSLAWLLNNSSGHGIRLDGYTFHDVLILIGYRLIHIIPLSSPRFACHPGAALHLALIAFMTAFMLGISRRVPQFLPLSNLARSAAQGHFNEDEDSQQVLLWMLFMGRASMFGQLDDVWLIPRILRTVGVLRLHNWEDALRMLSKFPWVNTVHGKAGRALWERSKSYNGTLSGIRTCLSASTIDPREACYEL